MSRGKQVDYACSATPDTGAGQLCVQRTGRAALAVQEHRGRHRRYRGGEGVDGRRLGGGEDAHGPQVTHSVPAAELLGADDSTGARKPWRTRVVIWGGNGDLSLEGRRMMMNELASAS